MKRIFTIVAALMLCMGMNAQKVNTGILQITLDVSKMSGDCRLSDADTVYMHSGLGWQSPDSLWQSIVGHWGQDDGIGRMTKIGNQLYSICFNVKDYYHNLASKDSTSPTGEGYGPMPLDSTPYNIGLVFRTAYCPYDPVTRHPECTKPQMGKDQNCGNIYIMNLDIPDAMEAQDDGGYPFPPISVEYITECAGVSAGINEANNSFTSILAYPIPFNTGMRVEFQYMEGIKPAVEIFNTVGQKVADLTSLVHKGHNILDWNGKDLNGVPTAAGMYLLKISNGEHSFTGKLIKQ